MADHLSRTPPIAVIRELRQEVGFRCPADSGGEPCGSPYLTWHHFDPPWRDEHHHRPAGMVALCQEHHQKADAGAFTVEQLRRMKGEGVTRAAMVQGRFDWMRRDYLSIIGGNAYLRTPVPLELNGQRAIWFNPNDREEMMLNFDFSVMGEQPRIAIRDNFWTVSPANINDLTCPPSGRQIRVDFKNGDVFHTRFRELKSSDELIKSHPWSGGWAAGLTYPLTLVEVWEKWSTSGMSLTPEGTNVGNGNLIKHGFMSDCGVGVSLGAPPVEPLPGGGIQRVLDEFRRLYGTDGYQPGRK